MSGHHGTPASRKSKNRGEEHGLHKITEEQARWALTCGLSCVECGRVLGVSHQHVSDIRRKRRWRHI